LITVREEIAPDPVVAGLVRDALAPNAEELSAVVGETAMALDRSTALEATMDTFLLHALRTAADTQLAFSNGWRYGAPILPGSVTLNELYNSVPMNPPITTVEFTSAELVAMIEENLERTYAADPYQQMGGYVKRCLGLRAYVKIKDPTGCSPYAGSPLTCWIPRWGVET